MSFDGLMIKKMKILDVQFFNFSKTLTFSSSRWSELLENVEARAFKLEAAAEIHRYHRDVTDVLERIHSYYRTLPNDLGSSLAQAQQLAKKHDAIENELLGIEAQVISPI